MPQANPLPNLTVLIGDNPLGRSAASQLIRLSTSAAVGRVNMANANLHHIALSAGTAAAATVGNGSGAPAAATRATPSSTVSHLAVVAGSDITFDRTATHCVYRLSLKFPGNCLVRTPLLHTSLNLYLKIASPVQGGANHSSLAIFLIDIKLCQ